MRWRAGLLAADTEVTRNADRVGLYRVEVDLVINEVVVGPRTEFGQGTKDALIDQKIGWALKADNGIYRDNYQFSVSNGVIYLLGVAQGPAEHNRVPGQARVIDGVKDIVPHVVFVADPRRAKT